MSTNMAGSRCQNCENVIFLLSLCRNEEMIITVECSGCSRLKRVMLDDLLTGNLGRCDLCGEGFVDLWWEDGEAVQYLQCYECKEVTAISLDDAHKALCDGISEEDPKESLEFLPTSKTIH